MTSTPAPEPPSSAPPPAPDPDPEPDEGLNERQRDIEQALDSMSGAAASSDAESAAGESTGDPDQAGEPTDDREASRVLYRLSDHGVHLTLRDGKLHASRDGGLTDLQRELLYEQGEALKRLLSEEAMSAVWSPAVRYVSEALRERGCAPDGTDAARAARLLNEAQDAYEAREDGLARYRLRRAALAAAGRLQP